jgi:hypothetical protein
MPFEKASDHALGDANHKFCVHCCDAQGQLKPYEEILSSMAHYLVRSQGVAQAAAVEVAKDVLANQPAWKDRHASH